MKSGKNGFSSTNVAIEWGNDVKDVITKSVTAAIPKKYNKHALALTEVCTANEHDLQKILQAFATLSKRFNGLAIKEGNKGDSGDKKGGGGGNNGNRGGGGDNHNASGKNYNKENNANCYNKKWVYTKVVEYDPTLLYKKIQWFNKERNLADKKLRREDPEQWKKNKRARL